MWQKKSFSEWTQFNKRIKAKGNNPFGSFPFHILQLKYFSNFTFAFILLPRDYLLCLIFACAAAKRAIGTRYGEQLT